MADNTGTTSEPQAEAPVHSDATADVAAGEPSTASAAGGAGAAAGDAPATPAATNAAIDFVSPASQASPTPDASPAGDAAVNGQKAEEDTADAGAGGDGEPAAPAEDDIVTSFSSTDLRKEKWMFCVVPQGKGVLLSRNNTKTVATVQLNESVKLAEGEERVREYSLDVVKPRYALEPQEMISVGNANLKLAAAKKKKSLWSAALAHYGRGIDYFNGVPEAGMPAAEYEKTVNAVLVGAYVNLAVCCEKYADHLDANPASAPAEATAPRRARPTASAMRKKAAKFCQQAASRNHDARLPLAYVRAYYCAAKVRLASAEYKEAITAARAGMKVPQEALKGVTKKTLQLVESHKKALRQVLDKAHAAKKAYNKKSGGFLLADKAKAAEAAAAPAPAPAVATGTTDASATGSGGTRTPSSSHRSPVRTSLATSHPRNKTVVFADEVTGGDDDNAKSGGARGDGTGSAADAGQASQEAPIGSLFAGAAGAVALLGLTAWLLVRMGRR